jgi:hypothetical protein
VTTRRIKLFVDPRDRTAEVAKLQGEQGALNVEAGENIEALKELEWELDQPPTWRAATGLAPLTDDEVEAMENEIKYRKHLDETFHARHRTLNAAISLEARRASDARHAKKVAADQKAARSFRKKPDSAKPGRVARFFEAKRARHQRDS